MSIVTISRGSYSRGKDVAEKVAKKLGYTCIGREDLLASSIEYNIPEVKYLKSIPNALSALDNFAGGKDRYVAYIQAALTSRVKSDNVVYHGLAGHFLLEGIAHVLKVRIIAPLEYRVKVVMERDNVSRQKAIRILKKDDDERYRWSRKLFLVDQRDCNLYDLMLNIDKCTVDDAVDLICHAVEFKGFRTTLESKKAMDNLQLTCAVKAELVDIEPDIEVSADDGYVTVKLITRGTEEDEDELAVAMKKAALDVTGVKDVAVNILRFASLE